MKMSIEANPKRLRVIAFFFVIVPFSILISQDLKKEISIPFPVSVEDSSAGKNKKAEVILPNEKKPTKDFIRIQFPDDITENKSVGVEFKNLDSEKTSQLGTNLNPENIDLPLEKLFVYPEMENIVSENSAKSESLEKKPDEKSNTKPLQPEDAKTISKNDLKNKLPESKPTEEQPTHDVGKALVNGNTKSSTATKESPNLKKSEVTGIDEYSRKETPPIAKKEVKTTKKIASNKENGEVSTKPEPVENKKTELAANNIPETKLPNMDKPSGKKGKEKKTVDESTPPFERSKYHLNRDDKPSAIPELNTASSSEGEKANSAKMDQIRLLAGDRKKNEAKNIIEGISEPEYKFKGLYELAVGLENSAKGDRKLKEEAIPFHLSIITEAPKTDIIVPKSLWALSHLLFTIGDHTPALDHLSEIIVNHSNSEYADDAIYLSGRIYEESPTVKNLNRAKKYYRLFMKNLPKKHFKSSMYSDFVKKRLELLEN